MSLYFGGMGNYWDIVEPFWEVINIYDGPEVFRQTYDSVPTLSGLVYAAHFCQSEVSNGGFHQFFWNSTGVLAPEAVDGFRAIGQPQIAALVQSAMSLLGTPYPRDRAERQAHLQKVSKGDLDGLDEKFYALIDSEGGGFEAAADAYVKSKGQTP